MRLSPAFDFAMEEEDTSLYRILGIDSTKQDVLSLSEKDIASAYRKAALKWHPDKNIGDASAASKFSQVFLAFETLSSPTKRKEYDDKIQNVRRRRQAWGQMDATRRRMRQQLQQREIQAAQSLHQSPSPNYTNVMNDSALARVQKEIERLRKQAMRDNTPKSGAKPFSKKTDIDKHDFDVGAWANVPNFSQFRSKTISISFEQFEHAILQGQCPFPE